MSGVYTVLQSTDTLVEVAQFFRALSERIEGELTPSDDARQVARVIGLRVPAVLDGEAIRSISSEEHERTPGVRITVQFPDEEVQEHAPAGSGVSARKGGGGGSSKNCWDQCWGALIGKVCLKVCADCSIKGTKIACTVTMTISASL